MRLGSLQVAVLDLLRACGGEVEQAVAVRQLCPHGRNVCATCSGAVARACRSLAMENHITRSGPGTRGTWTLRLRSPEASS